MAVQVVMFEVSFTGNVPKQMSGDHRRESCGRTQRGSNGSKLSLVRRKRRQA